MKHDSHNFTTSLLLFCTIFYKETTDSLLRSTNVSVLICSAFVQRYFEVMISFAKTLFLNWDYYSFLYYVWNITCGRGNTSFMLNVFIDNGTHLSHRFWQIWVLLMILWKTGSSILTVLIPFCIKFEKLKKESLVY